MSKLGDPADRFDLEQQIMSCWNVIEDIKTVYHAEDIRKLTEDELANSLIGIMTLYEMKFEKLWDTYETMVKAGKIK